MTQSSHRLKKNHVDAIYLDFSKAFDKVDHNTLLCKIKILGIGGKIYSWIESFLKHRQQAVRVQGILSDREWVLSGIPQGSVLGPLLLLIMMHDITDDIHNTALSSFADDTRLWKKVSTLQDSVLLQSDLIELYNWADKNNMEYNGDKFEGMQYGNKEPQTYTTPNLQNIDTQMQVNDLGVIMSEDLTFGLHINNIVAKGHRMSGWILRTVNTRRDDYMKRLLKTLVISQMEYCCVLWSPIDQQNINLLENVQLKFTRKCASFQVFDPILQIPVCKINYHERLRRLKIYSLERRRERMQIFYIYKILLGTVPNPGFTFKYNIRTKYRMDPMMKQHAKAWIRKIRNSSFFVRGPQLYNSLPQHLRELEDTTKTTATNFEKFKKDLDQYLETLEDQPGRANSILEHMDRRL